MELKYKIDKPESFSQQEKESFISLLKKQDQVKNPNLEKIKSCSFICISFVDNIPIGIGAVKHIYQKPFDYAGVKELKELFEFEIGYLFVDNESNNHNYRNLGIGKSMVRLLLGKIETQNVFATADFNIKNPMIHILRSYGFESVGVPFKGRKTKKLISLLLLTRNKTD